MGLIPEHRAGEAKHKVRFFFFPPSAINFKLLILNYTERVKTSRTRALHHQIPKELGLGDGPALPAAHEWPTAPETSSSPGTSRTPGTSSPPVPGIQPLFPPGRTNVGTSQGCGTGTSVHPHPPQPFPAQVRTFQEQTAQHKEGISGQPEPSWECEVLPTLRNAPQSSCPAPCVPGSSLYSKGRIFQDSTGQGVPAQLPQVAQAPQCPSCAPQAGLAVSSEPGTSTAPGAGLQPGHTPHPTSHIPAPGAPLPQPALPPP